MGLPLLRILSWKSWRDCARDGVTDFTRPLASFGIHSMWSIINHLKGSNTEVTVGFI